MNYTDFLIKSIEEPSSTPEDDGSSDKYVGEVIHEYPDGIDINIVFHDIDDLNLSLQIKILMRLAKYDLLKGPSGNNLTPQDIIDIVNDGHVLARNKFSLNEIGVILPGKGNLPQEYYPLIQENINNIIPIMRKEHYKYITYVSGLGWTSALRAGTMAKNNLGKYDFVPDPTGKLHSYSVIDNTISQNLFDIGMLLTYNEELGQAQKDGDRLFVIEDSGAIWIGKPANNLFHYEKFQLDEIGINIPTDYHKLYHIDIKSPERVFSPYHRGMTFNSWVLETNDLSYRKLITPKHKISDKGTLYEINVANLISIYDKMKLYIHSDINQNLLSYRRSVIDSTNKKVLEKYSLYIKSIFPKATITSKPNKIDTFSKILIYYPSPKGKTTAKIYQPTPGQSLRSWIADNFYINFTDELKNGGYSIKSYKLTKLFLSDAESVKKLESFLKRKFDPSIKISTISTPRIITYTDPSQIKAK